MLLLHFQVSLSSRDLVRILIEITLAFIVASTSKHTFIFVFEKWNLTSLPSGLHTHRKITVKSFLHFVSFKYNDPNLKIFSLSFSRLPWWSLILALVFSVMTLPFYGAMYAIFA